VRRGHLRATDGRIQRNEEGLMLLICLSRQNCRKRPAENLTCYLTISAP
jgi:hypothetical protein